MKYVTLAAATVLAAAVVNTAHAENRPSTFNAIRTAPAPIEAGMAEAPAAQIGTSAASLNALLTEWDRAGFLTPNKPSQYRVYGRNGYVTSGPGYNTLVALIRSAANDVRAGRNREAEMEIVKARALLAATRPAQE